MRFHIIILLALTVLLPPIEGHADLLCVPKAVKPSKDGTIPFAKNIVVAATCPRNYRAVLNTDNFKGPKGDAGEVGSKGDKGDKGDRGVAGIGYSTCQRRERLFNAVVNNANRTTVQTATLNCEPGEFALAKQSSLTVERSVDWSEDGDTTYAGTTQTGSGLDAGTVPHVLDSDGFPIGYGFSVGGYDSGTLLTGSQSVSLQVTITCCSIGD